MQKHDGKRTWWKVSQALTSSQLCAQRARTKQAARIEAVLRLSPSCQVAGHTQWRKNKGNSDVTYPLGDFRKEQILSEASLPYSLRRSAVVPTFRARFNRPRTDASPGRGLSGH